MSLADHTESWFQWFEPSAVVIAAILLVAVCLIAWASNLIALPGNWVSVFLIAFYVWLGPNEGRPAIGMFGLVTAFMLAVGGEVFEFLAGAAGAQRAGAGRRSTLLAMAGSLVGALIGALVGLPIPVVGSVLAAILFAGLGATAGAMYGEWSDGRPWRENWAIGHAAFWGRTFGTLGKLVMGALIVLLVIVGVLF